MKTREEIDLTVDDKRERWECNGCESRCVKLLLKGEIAEKRCEYVCGSGSCWKKVGAK